MILIGCPILRREWVVEKWFMAVDRAAANAGIHLDDVGFIFVGDPDHDPTFKKIEEFCPTPNLHIVPVMDTRTNLARDWNQKRYRRMVDLRNELLVGVREVGPDLFLSLDSDILLHGNALRSMILLLEEKGWAAVGGRCYLSQTGERCPSWGRLGRDGQLQRRDADGQFEVPIIMAIKLMTAAAYNIDYEFHTQGEDTGWSLACGRAGLKLGWDGMQISKHLWSSQHLNLIDRRLGW